MRYPFRLNESEYVDESGSDDIEAFLRHQKAIESSNTSTPQDLKDYAKWKKANKKSKPKEKKVFKVGDTIICVESEKGKLPQDAYDYILTYKYFVVKDVNDKLNIDIGHITADTHNPFYFGPNRFELKDGKAPTKIIDSEGNIIEKPREEISGIDPYGEENWGNKNKDDKSLAPAMYLRSQWTVAKTKTRSDLEFDGNFPPDENWDDEKGKIKLSKPTVKKYTKKIYVDDKGRKYTLNSCGGRDYIPEERKRIKFTECGGTATSSC
jgi:hypothetical protein